MPTTPPPPSPPPPRAAGALTAADDALLASVAADERVANGIPTPDQVADRERAAAAVAAALGPVLADDGLRVSPLGPGWSRDLDAHLRAPVDPGELTARGWLPLDGLLRRVGSPTSGRWAVVVDGAVLGALDLDTASRPDPLDGVLARCRRRGEVRVREVLELRVLQRAGRQLPSCEVVSAAADAEHRLAGDELARHRTSGPRHAPVPVSLGSPVGAKAQLRRLAGGVRRRLRRRVVVALSGVDGAGKSTLAAGLAHDLDRAGVPNGGVWARPGLHLGWLDTFSRIAKRALGQPGEPGVRAVARDEGDALASRQGALGGIWVTLVTLSFLVDVWRQHLTARGVVVYDRHVIDAETTLGFVYATAPLTLPRWLVRHLLPRADLSVHLDVPVEVAVARKPGDTFGAHAVRSQIAAYERLLAATPRIVRLDATTPPGDIRREVLRRLV